MLQTETVIEDGREFVHAWSDANMLIANATTGQRYVEAYDPADLDEPRTYIETDQPIPTPTPSPAELAEAARIMLGM